MKNNQNLKKATVQIPLILGLASAAAAVIFISRAAVQNTRTEVKPFPAMEYKEEVVHPQEIQAVLKEIKDMKKEIRRLNTQAKKLPNLNNEMNRLREISGQLDRFSQNSQNPPAGTSQHQVIQEFRQAQFWQIINTIRAKIEFPKQVKNLEKELKRAESALKQKIYQKIILDLPEIRNKINLMKNALEGAKNQYQAGQVEEALSSLHEIQTKASPGEIVCLLQTVRDINRNLPKIKNSEIRLSIQDILNLIIGKIREGEFRQTCQSFGEVRQEIFRAIEHIKAGRAIDSGMRQNLQNIQNSIVERFERIEAEKKFREAPKIETSPQQIEMPKVEEKPIPLIPSIKVTFPNGGEKWELNSNQTIYWTSNNYSVDSPINIYLLRGLTGDGMTTFEMIKHIALNTPNDGKENWLVQDVAVGNNYYIQVGCSGCSGDNSDGPFSVVEAAPVVSPQTSITSFKKTDDAICTSNGKPIIRLFSTASCSHCQWIFPAFEAVIKEYEGKIVAYDWQMDTKDNVLTAEKEEQVPAFENEIFYKYNPSVSFPTLVFGCKYFRIGTAYENNGGLEAEKKEFRLVIDALLREN